MKNNDINGIVRTSRYETKGFYFVKTFFGELFVDSVVLDDFKFYTDSSSSRVSKRIHRNLLNEFLAYYTNIDELVEQFIFNVNNTKHFSFIENY
ncbi:hypothetical protein HOA93_01205 [bacterium]|nr:hypothetical protein [bacterium]